MHYQNVHLKGKREVFKNYLLERLGYIKDAFFFEFIWTLFKNANKYKDLATCRAVWDEAEKCYAPEEPNKYLNYELKGDVFVPVSIGILDLLKLEVDLKKKGRINPLPVKKSAISASEIGDFKFCPVSFAIRKSFKIEKTLALKQGSYLHEQSLLIKYFKPVREVILDENWELVEVDYVKNWQHLKNESNGYFFDYLSDSELIYSGHNNAADRLKVFKNHKGNFIAQPDYIFQNKKSGEFFVVEEKFKWIPSLQSSDSDTWSDEFLEKITGIREDKSFFENHISQINSYVQGISEPKISRGFLIYWKYETNNSGYNIVDCQFKEIRKSEAGKEKFVSDFKQISEFIRSGNLDFDKNDRSPKKCANCSTMILCGHKTGRFKSISYPYSKNFLQLLHVEFPDDLKKKE